MFNDLISKHSFIVYPETQYASSKEKWENTTDATWMLNDYQSRNPENTRQFSLVKGKCALLIYHLLNDSRNRNAINAAIDYGEYRIDLDELQEINMHAFESEMEYVQKFYWNFDFPLRSALSASVKASQIVANAGDVANAVSHALSNEYKNVRDRKKREHGVLSYMSDLCREYLVFNDS